VNIILTGSKGTVAYFGGQTSAAFPSKRRAVHTELIQGKRCNFAALPVFSANTNAIPSTDNGAVPSSQMMGFLHNIARA
jgi:hypothetical protein